MKVKVLLILSVLLVLSLAYALPEIIIDVLEQDNIITYDGIAKFKLEITNNQDFADKIYIETPRNEWSITVDKYILEIPAKSSETVTILISPPQDVKAGKYSIYFGFKNLNGSKLANYQYLHVTVTNSAPSEEIAREGKADIKTETSTGFLTIKKEVVITNIGDGLLEGEWTETFSDFDKFFVESDPKETKIEGATYYWSYSLAPQESITITYSVSYLPIVVALGIILIALILLGFFYISKFKLVKEVRIQKKVTPEGKKVIKVKLALKNNTALEQKGVVVEDYVPVPLVVAMDSFGTVKPTAIKRLKNRTALIWKFDKLEPQDEILISYGMRSRLEVIGKVTLPPAIVKQKEGKKEIKVFSRIRVLS